MQQRLEAQLKECSSDSLLDLKPLENTDVAFVIELIDPHQKPIATKSRTLPHQLKDKVREELMSQLNAKIIRRSTSAWASALQVVHKQDKSLRITVDYKPLNKVILVPQYPLPAVADLYASLAKSSFFSKIDMKAAYHQIPVHPDSIKYTAFICEFGLFEYLSMPMGISSAPGWFQRFIEGVLTKFIERQVLSVYLDDVILHTPSLQRHELEASELMSTLKQRAVITSYKKSELAKTSITFLGNMISHGSIKPHPKRATALRDMPLPKTIFDLQRALGMMNYSRLFIPDFAELSRPLYALLNLKEVPESLRKRNGAVDGKRVALEWTDETRASFARLVDIMCSDLVLALPDFTKPYTLTTDAYDFGYGAILEQEIDGQMHIIAYFSISLVCYRTGVTM